MTALADAIKKVATGPHLSKNLSLEEAKLAMLEILSGEADPVQAAIFFISLRIKRETDDENVGILQALQDYTEQTEADVKQLLIINEPFNGFNRHCPVSAFLPAVLAASGLPTISQGVKEMGPKFGVTHSQVLSQAGLNTNLSVQAVTDKVNNSDIGWGFINQAQASPKLYALQDLRTRMIKRPSLATLEKLVMPIRAKDKTHVQIGFVHKEYPPILAYAAQQAGFASALIIRGIEGGILPTLREPSNCFRSFDGKVELSVINPTEFGVKQTTRGVLPTNEMVTAAQTVESGLQALSGQAGAAFDSLVLGGTMALWHCGLQISQQQAADHIRQIIKSGKAKSYFESGL
ncbi:MAG: anthranilate phosphoribosyltransferase [Methylophagaceae bacterium]